MSSLSLSITAWSHPGRVRQANDDHYLCGTFVEQDSLCHLVMPLASRTVQEHGFLCAVADGMGGYAGGNLASRTILETLAGFFYAEKREGATPDAMRAALETGFDHARSALNSHLRRDPQLSEAGTTLAGLVVLADGTALPFHLGDSRVLRESGGFVRALTVDHTPLATEIESGHLSEEDAARSPIASRLTRSFGLDDASPVEWGEPLQLAPGDLFLLGTDGWHGLGRGLTSRALRETLNGFVGDDCALVRLLVESAVDSDGSDNATLLIVRVAALPEATEPAAVQTVEALPTTALSATVQPALSTPHPGATGDLPRPEQLAVSGPPLPEYSSLVPAKPLTKETDSLP